MLGLLVDGESSGYDLLRQAERSVGFFWTPAKTQLYAILRKLVANGFATARLVRQADRPDKTLYRITDAGRGAPARRASSRCSSTVNKNPLELRIFFGEHRPLEAVVADLEAVRDHAARAPRGARRDRGHVRPRRVPVPVPDAAARQGERGGRRGVGGAGARAAGAAHDDRVAPFVVLALAAVFVPGSAPLGHRTVVLGHDPLPRRRDVERDAEARASEPSRSASARATSRTRRCRSSAKGKTLRFSAPGLPKPIVVRPDGEGQEADGDGDAGSGARDGHADAADGRAPTRSSGYFASPSVEVARFTTHGFSTRARSLIDLATGAFGAAPARIGARLDVRQYDVRFPNGKTTLTGTLTIPPGAGPHPGVVYVSGSGDTLREEAHWLDGLFVSRGIAVLAYDKRGVGQSGGVYPGDLASEETINTLAGDAAAAARFLAAQPGIDRSRVGFYGLSQGGWIIPQAAVRAGGRRVVGADPVRPDGDAGRVGHLRGPRHDH